MYVRHPFFQVDASDMFGSSPFLAATDYQAEARYPNVSTGYVMGSRCARNA